MARKQTGKTMEEAAAAMVQAMKNVPLKVGNTAVNFFKDNFKQEGFQGDFGLQKWQERNERAPRNDSRRLLTDTGLLQRSIVKQVLGAKVKVFVQGLADDYAGIHNEGGTITVPVTKQMRKFFWAKYQASKDAFWRNLATTKKTVLNIEIPQRKFIGNSRQLNAKIEQLIINELKKALK